MSLSRRDFIKLLSSAIVVQVLPKVQTEPPVQSDVDELRELVFCQPETWVCHTMVGRNPRAYIDDKEIDGPIAWSIEVEYPMSSLPPPFEAYSEVGSSFWSGSISTLHYPDGWTDWGKIPLEIAHLKGIAIITSVEQVGPFYDIQFVGDGPLTREMET